MVARISSGRGVHNALNYNEHKVENRQAELVCANGYPKAADKLSMSDKLNRLIKLTALNKRSKIHGVHISLNFDPSEKLNRKMIEQIAARYMDGIGFGGQPFLVYQHFDAGHPHIHIVTTNIQKDGTRISLHNIGRNQSEKIRKEIERDFKLVPAGGTKKTEQYRIQPIPVKAVQYGKEETRKAISDIVREIIKSYRFTSLGELNAVLSMYNVMADRGNEDSFLYKKRGLQYRILDMNGNKVGVPVKASTVSAKPTLSTLENKFKVNELLRKPFKEPLKQQLTAILGQSGNINCRQFLDAVAARNIRVVIRENAQGRIYGMTYIDLNSKCVFNGSALGKEFSANTISAKFAAVENPSDSPYDPSMTNRKLDDAPRGQSIELLRELTDPERIDQSNPHFPKKKKKKRKGPRL